MLLHWWQTVSQVQPPRRVPPLPPQSTSFLEDEVKHTALSSLLLGEKRSTTDGYGDAGNLCVACANGHVLFRATSAAIGKTTASVSLLTQELMVRVQSTEDNARQLPSLSTAEDCVAHLHRLGLLQPPCAMKATDHNDSCVLLRATVYILSGADNTSAAAAGQQCGAIVARLRLSNEKATTMEVATPRLTEWPITPTHPQEKTLTSPPYVGTAMVGETDVDADLFPPTHITVENSSATFVVHFEALTAANTRELHCPLRFLTVKLGRYGRHHNQLQQVLHGVAIAARLNRTFLLPPFVAADYAEFVRLDSEILYGWQTLRQVGRYCLVTYNEARPLLQQVREATQKGPLTVSRVHVAANVAEKDGQQQQQQQEEATTASDDWEMRVWGSLPRVPCKLSTTPLFNADAWFASGVPRKPRRHSLRGTGDANNASDVLLLQEVQTAPLSTASSLTTPQMRRDVYRAAAETLRTQFDGAAEGPPVDLVVLSSETAFHLRPRLKEATRLLGLLRPSPSITSEVGRFYRLWAPQYKWPVYNNPLRTFEDCLQPGRFRAVVGMDVYAGGNATCQHAVANLIENARHLSRVGAYMLEGMKEVFRLGKDAPRTSTAARLTADCAWDVHSVVHLFRQYARWLAARELNSRHNATVAGSPATRSPYPQHENNGGGGRKAGTGTHYTAFLAYDANMGSMAEKTEVELQRHYTPLAHELLSNGMRPSFTAAYDRHTRVDFREAYDSARRRVAAAAAAGTLNLTAEDETATADAVEHLLLKLLYPLAEQEMMGQAFDLFMLSNTGVFRGNALLPASVNVCLRRWGRRLPCHGVMPGYYEVLYNGVL